MASATPDPILKTYTGSCACSGFTYTVDLPVLTSVFECNCSICARKAYKWVFPGADCFKIVEDKGLMKDYEFGGKGMAHKFCSVCGTGVYGMRHNAQPGMNMGLNVRTLNDIDILSVPIGQTFDGLALPPTYTPIPSKPAYTHTGSCHCQEITISFSSELPVEELEVTECTCKSCVRAAPLLLTPEIPRSSISIQNENSTSYAPHHSSSNSSSETQTFCSTCGVCVYAQDKGDDSPTNVGYRLNMRCFPESVDVAKLKVERVGGEVV